MQGWSGGQLGHDLNRVQNMGRMLLYGLRVGKVTDGYPSTTSDRAKHGVGGGCVCMMSARKAYVISVGTGWLWI